MAYVQPTGTIQLFRGINLDNRYMHTLYFASTSAQTAFFDALVDPQLTFGAGSGNRDATAQSYIRHNKNSVRLHILCDYCIEATYMRFNNNRGTGKWFYAFVTSINYINENTTEITYEIDVMQTWFFQTGHAIQPCYVEREHVSNSKDKLTLQLEPEPFGSDIYDFTEIQTVSGAGYQTMDQIFAPEDPSHQTTISSYSFVMNTTSEPGVTDGHMWRDGIINGTNFIALDPLDVVRIKEAMEEQLGSWDKSEQKADIVDMFMFPTYFAGQMSGSEGSYEYMEGYGPHDQATVAIQHPKKYSNYVPQNSKMYGYPFSFLYVTTMDGDAGQYRWEYFEGDVPTASASSYIEFEMNAACSGGGIIEMHPRSYNGIDNNTDTKVVMNNFPKCSYAYDAYQAYVAAGGQTKALYQASMAENKGMNAKRQNYISNAPKALLQGTAAVGAGVVATTVSGGLAAAAVPAMMSAGTTTTMGLKEQAIEYQVDEALHKVAFEFGDAMYEPNMVVGAATPNIAVGHGYLSYRFYNVHIRDDEMVKVDNYLTMYGYAINNVKSPRLTGRSHWNFVKTRDSVIAGNMPASSKAAIAKIFDGGIFLWNSSGTPSTVNSNIGNFTQEVNSHGQIINHNI